MSVLVCLLVLLPFQAFGASLVIPTEPHREEIERVRRYRLVYGFQQSSSGEFQVHIKVRYQPTWSRLKRSEHIMLPLQRGTIVERDPETLMMRLDNRELVVGKHRWWYSPYWQAAKGVRITCDHNQQLSTVVVENCRLKIHTP